MAEIRTQRIYDPASKDDGCRILIDRLWPRGVSKQRAAIDYWARDAAPSDALRRWYRHEHAKWPEFRRRYFAELRANPDAVARLREYLARGTVTLVFASRETERNNASALRDFLERE